MLPVTPAINYRYYSKYWATWSCCRSSCFARICFVNFIIYRNL